MTTRLISSGIVRSNERNPDFYVRNRDMQLCSGQRPGKSRVGVTIDEHEIGLLLQEHILHPHQDLTGLFPVRPGSDAKVVVRQGSPVHQKIFRTSPGHSAARYGRESPHAPSGARARPGRT